MFCPQCGNQQATETTRFCSRCGFSLDFIAGMIARNDQQLQNEKREVEGITALMTLVLVLLNFIVVFGLITLPHLTHPVYLILWLFLLLISFTIGGIGVTKLVRSGFFSRLKERGLRLQLAKLQQKQQQLSEKPTDVGTTPPTSLILEPPSVIERTTRELRSTPRELR